MVYAFSAFSLDSTYYYIFLDTIAFFPLIPLFADRVLEGKGKVGFSLVVLLNAVVNYYLFVSTSIFFLLYLINRVRKTSDCAAKDAVRCVLYYALGAMASMALLLPALLTLLETGKATDSFSEIWIGAVTAIPQVIRILRAFVLPNEGILHSATGFTFFTFYSNAAFLPFFGALFAVAAICSRQKTWDVCLLRLLVFLSLIPFGNGLFSLFSTMNYTRWWYALVLMAVLVSLHSQESYLKNPVAWREPLQKSAKVIVRIAAITTLPFFAVKLLCGYFFSDFIHDRFPEAAVHAMEANGLLQHFNSKDMGYLIVLPVLTALSYIPLYHALRKGWIRNKRILIAAVTLICALSYCIYLANECSVFTDENVPRAEKVSMVSDPETVYSSRTEFKTSYSNYGMLANEPSINSFNSFKSKSTIAFCSLAGFDTGSVTKKHFTTPAIQTVLNIRYVMSDNGERQDAEYYVPFGFVYDQYVIDTGVTATKDKDENNKRIEQMCIACYLDAETAQALQGVVTPLEKDASDWKQASAAKRQSACTNCILSSSGFRASSAGEKDRLVYFSIPHDRGWTAYVDGNPVVIHTVNGGMMGVVVPAGNHQIEFRFQTPGLFLGIWISFAAFVIIIILGICSEKLKHTRSK